MVKRSKEVSVTKGGNLPAAVAGLASGLRSAASAVADAAGGDAFGRFDKHGDWLFGSGLETVEEGSRWAINPTTLRHGWIHWPDDGRPTEVTVLAHEPMPAPNDLPAVDGDWTNSFAFQARCLSGEDKGVQVIFKGSSLGFKKAWAAMVAALVKQLDGGTDEIVPVVELEADSYTHQKYGKIYTPEIKIVDWTTMDSEPEDEPEPEPEEEKPARRRRVRK